MNKKQEDRTIILDNGEITKATFPVVVSASRSTDIPAFYADWFFDRLRKGYSAWTNPFNGKKAILPMRILGSLFFGRKTLVHFLIILTI